MNDPLRLIHATSPMRPAGFPQQGQTPAGGVSPDPSAPSFKDLLKENVRQVNRLEQEATRAIEDLQTGKRTDVEGVLLATQKADTAFRMLLAVRNKVQQAYEEIKQLRT